jgi:hypothetical protein
MEIISATEFLQQWAARFSNDEIRNWVWSSDEDDVFGKRASWRVGEDPAMEAVASAELMLDQIQLTITERDLATSSEGMSDADATVVFDAQIQFEEQSIVLDGEPLPWGEKSIASVVQQFNERA